MPRIAKRLPGSFEDRCLALSEKVAADALKLPPGPQRDEMLRKARQNKIAASLDQWLSSPGLRPPT